MGNKATAQDRKATFNADVIRKIEPHLEELNMEDRKAIWQGLKETLVSSLEELPQDDEASKNACQKNSEF